MGYIRRKIKTRRRVKRTKTNTRKRKQNRTFRKSRRVNRGGADKRSRRTMEDNWQTDTRTEKEKSEQDAIENKKDKKNQLKRVANIRRNLYLEPGSEGVAVNQIEQLETTDRQTGLMDDIDAETDAETDTEEQPGKRRRLKGGPISFGGKKKRSIKK
jgi:hypothetical protein